MLLILLGALPAVVLRYIILGKPISRSSALGILFIYLIVGLWLIVNVLNEQQHTWFSASVAVSFFILTAKSRRMNEQEEKHMQKDDEGIWELEIFHRKPNTAEGWKQGVPQGMSVGEACEAIKKLAEARNETRNQ